VGRAPIERGLSAATLPGRFQVLPGRPQRVLDVAHNAAAARNLLHNLAAHPVGGRTLLVCAMLADKPVAQVLRLLDPVADRWYLAPLVEPRGADEKALRGFVAAADLAAAPTYWPDPPAAFRAACEEAGPRDRVVAFGSFYTVGAILRALGAAGAMAVSPTTPAPQAFK
jgi:dihydrofolate synthase / folylpolyglutamate synthase